METCPYCNTASLAPNRVQCGAPACKLARAAQKQREWQRRYTARTGSSAARRYPSRANARKSNSTCIDCSAPVGHGRTQETRCRKCGQRANWQRREAGAKVLRRLARARRLLAAAAAGTSRGWTFVNGPCASCGLDFTCQLMNAPGRFCSRTCQRRDAKAIRRARQKGADITPGQRWRVFEHDGWLCRICGDSVNRAAKAPELAAPVVDHRIPLAHGGTHGPENWQTAHFYCNSVKRDQLGYDFAEVAA